MSNLSTFTSKSTDRKITLNNYAARLVLRVAGALFIVAGLYTLLYYLPSQGTIIRHENIIPIKIMSFAGIIAGILTFYRKRIILDKDLAMLSKTRDILFRLTRKRMPLSAYESLFLTYQICNESPVVPGEVNPSIHSLYIYQLYLRSPNDEQLLIELQESSAPLNDEPNRCLFTIEQLAREISTLTGKPLNYSENIKDSLKRLA